MNNKFSKRAYWCDHCNIPTIESRCLSCERNGRDISSAHLVPVFRPEINFLKKLLDKKIHPLLKEGELWVSPNNHTYFCQGIPILKLSTVNGHSKLFSHYKNIKPLKRTKADFINTLKSANKKYIEKIKYEAEVFIKNTIESHIGKTNLVSFSGGKDSTVVSHLVMNSIGRSNVLHAFADTTIEYPDTYKFIAEFQQKHPLTPFIQSQTKLDFFETAKAIGPPSRILRWCCTTHKTNPLSKLIDSMSPKHGVLTFDGMRRYESTRRANYPRISDKHKIAREVLARPILEWSDFQVWLYILYHKLPFNQSYKKGFRRVGCLYCPFNSDWSQLMISDRYPAHIKKWNQFLRNQALRMKHPSPDIFVQKGWRARAGGRGLDSYKSFVESSPCILSESAVMYQLLSGNIKLVRDFLLPFGPQSIVNSDQYSDSFLIHDSKTKEILASVEVGFTDKAFRVNYLLKKNRRLFRQRLEKQIKKLQVCIYCGACGAICKSKALKSDEDFAINVKRCTNCLKCVSHNCPIVKSLHYKG